ncbi:MAG: AlpA family transcriptional regulator [Nitrospirota bacterium]|nr:AlpA family transcriptional regulator [Nitrospirota bacterium]
MVQRILRLPEVKNLTGLSRSTLYNYISRNEFPAPVGLGPRSVGWLEGDIQSWIDQRIAASRPTGRR